MIDKSLILHLPFHDPDGSKAYDYSQSRADADLSGDAKLIKDADAGKALSIKGVGEAITAKAIPFNTDFTLTINIKTPHNRIGWVLNSPGVEKFIERWISVAPNRREFLAFVKSGNSFTVYRNKEVVFVGTISGTPNGFALCDDDLIETNVIIDDVQLYNRALKEKEVLMIQGANDDVEYFLDGFNFKEYGV